jgi:3-methyladenine DNA glycosylase AlkD
MNKHIDLLRKRLTEAADEKTREGSQHFFKETVQVYGVKAKPLKAISKELYQPLKSHSKDEILLLCETLWQSGMLEESFVAGDWCYARRKEYVPDDLIFFRRWIDKYVSNWASCDNFCNHSMGELMMRYPELLIELLGFTGSENRWMRRAAAVSLIVPARKGMFIDIVFKIADLLLHDHDDMVQKGYGWMLKVAAKHHQEKVFDFVMKHRETMPRTALRYAIEKMPEALRREAMKRN